MQSIYHFIPFIVADIYVIMMMYNHTRIYLVYLNIPLAAFFTSISDNDLAFFGFILL